MKNVGYALFDKLDYLGPPQIPWEPLGPKKPEAHGPQMLKARVWGPKPDPKAREPSPARKNHTSESTGKSTYVIGEPDDRKQHLFSEFEREGQQQQHLCLASLSPNS